MGQGPEDMATRPRTVWWVLHAHQAAGPRRACMWGRFPTPLSWPLEQATAVAAQLALSSRVKQDMRAAEGTWKLLSPRPGAGATSLRGKGRHTGQGR